MPRRLFSVAAAKKPKMVVGGSRGEAFKIFKNELKDPKKSTTDFVALLIDSEDPLQELDKTWEHLRKREGDQWQKPSGCTNEQVLFMATCMETWICADLDLLKSKFKNKLQLSALPDLFQIERRGRKELLRALDRATRNCQSPYGKGTNSFFLLGELNPETLAKHLPSFARLQRILKEKL
jgi:hypothetical protein